MSTAIGSELSLTANDSVKGQEGLTEAIVEAIKDSINVERDNLNTANDERTLAANKLLLERQNIPVTEENLMLLSEKLKEQKAAIRKEVEEEAEFEVVEDGTAS